jgi:hypothetical protein
MVALLAILVTLSIPSIAQAASCPTPEEQTARSEMEMAATTQAAAPSTQSRANRRKAAGKTKKKKAKKAKAKTVTLTPTEASVVLNFGRQRGTKEIDIVLTAEPALKPFAPDKLEIYVPRRFPRQGDGMESLVFKKPTFSTPEVHENGTKITFTACLDAKDETPGGYSGEIVVSGPQIAGSTRVAVIANVKEWCWFLVGLFLALVGAFGLLLYRPMQEHPEGKAWRKATLQSPAWWVETLASLAAGAIAAWAIYSQDPAWGSDIPTALVSLIGAAFAAAGVQTLISTVRKGGSGGTENGDGNGAPGGGGTGGGTPSTPPAKPHITR